jgi:hypothetical protein
MDRMIQRLKEKVGDSGAAEQEAWVAFHLIAAACSYCCTNRTGGNETCPPKTEVLEP